LGVLEQLAADPLRGPISQRILHAQLADLHPLDCALGRAADRFTLVFAPASGFIDSAYLPHHDERMLLGKIKWSPALPVGPDLQCE
jgi:hypothetical protein